MTATPCRHSVTTTTIRSGLISRLHFPCASTTPIPVCDRLGVHKISALLERPRVASCVHLPSAKHALSTSRVGNIVFSRKFNSISAHKIINIRMQALSVRFQCILTDAQRNHWKIKIQVWMRMFEYFNKVLKIIFLEKVFVFAGFLPRHRNSLDLNERIPVELDQIAAYRMPRVKFESQKGELCARSEISFAEAL